MQGIERSYCETMIDAALDANDALLSQNTEEAISSSHVRYKGDTLGLDQIPENAIVDRLRHFDRYAAIVTEERGEEVNPLLVSSQASRGPRTFFACDPTDRSSQFKQFLDKHKNIKDGNTRTTVGDILRQKNAVALWEEDHGAPVSITGPNSAITCIRRGIPICSVLLNFLTQELTIACSAGILQATVEPADNQTRARVNLGDMLATDNHLAISPVERTKEHMMRYVGFVGKPERGYPQNIRECNLFEDENQIEHYNHYKQPGGPTRILYLTQIQSVITQIGFIVSNGEKIGEWAHWLPFIRFMRMQKDMGQKALRLFELSQDQSMMRDGYLLAPSPIYSILKEVSGDPQKRVRVDLDTLEHYPNPSKYRATLLITPADNYWALQRVEQFGYREIVFMDQ